MSVDPAPGNAAPRVVVVHQAPAAHACRERGLVLQAVGITCAVTRLGAIWIVAVPEEEAQRALVELAAWEGENAGWPPRETPFLPRAGATAHALLWVALLSGVFVLERASAVPMKENGLARADLVRGAEPWRALTALTLHADFLHLASNLVFGALFLVLLAQTVGGGLAWSAVFLAGAAGNYANAWIHGPEHASLGASTAVFAAIGVQSGFLWSARRRIRLPSSRRLAPLLGGIGLLAWLGFGGGHERAQRIDIGAHLCGFVAGALLGVLLDRALDPRLVSRLQDRALVALTWAALFVAWGLAIAP